jgi:putative membrane-bound dehydrogenase-like protein
MLKSAAFVGCFLFGVTLFATPPQVTDPRLKIELFAESPQIVTPIGIAVDGKGRVFVVESHTHQRPAGYQGPKTDRIRMFEDTKGTGKADKITTFFEGTNQTMCLAFDRDGVLYVATRMEIFRLRDTKGTGAADERTSIVHLETTGTYPHDGLAGMAFDFNGDLYFGMGENLGFPYKLIGSDGSSVSGGGEGGNIFHCKPDGSHVERFATGFWNPFQCCFDTFGRLFTVDNDPDSRPPCRLLHVVEGGDYGYRFRYGRKGTHPFDAWNGELPGTLPMASATGEAPAGLVCYDSVNLPDQYRGGLLATSWGDHRIDYF